MSNVPRIARKSDHAYRLWIKLFTNSLKHYWWIQLIGLVLVFITPLDYDHNNSSSRIWPVITVIVLTTLLLVQIIVAYFKAVERLEDEIGK